MALRGQTERKKDCYSTSTQPFRSFCSTSANVAAAAGGFIYFLSYLPYLFLWPRYDLLSHAQKVSACLISNVAMAMGAQLIGMFEGKGEPGDYVVNGREYIIRFFLCISNSNFPGVYCPCPSLQALEFSGPTCLIRWRWMTTSRWPRFWVCCCLTLCSTGSWPGTWRPFFPGSTECLYRHTSFYWYASKLSSLVFCERN